MGISTAAPAPAPLAARVNKPPTLGDSNAEFKPKPLGIAKRNLSTTTSKRAAGIAYKNVLKLSTSTGLPYLISASLSLSL